MSKLRVLMSGLGGSLFPFLDEKLNNTYDLYYVDSDESLLELYPKLSFFVAPKVTDPSYIDFILNLISKYNIDVYIPLIDEEIEVAHLIKKQVPGLKLLSPRLEFCKLAMRKDLLMKSLNDNGVSSIKTWIGSEFIWEKDKVYFVKPISGRGSRGIRKFETQNELAAYYLLEDYAPQDVIIQEYISGQEYTVGVLINNLGDIVYLSSRKVINKKGITIKAITENNSIIENAVQLINSKLKPHGPINVQLYVTESNEVKIFEINPRFSTTSIMSYHYEINEIGLWLKYFDCSFKEAYFRPKENLVLHRRWENVFYEKS